MSLLYLSKLIAAVGTPSNVGNETVRVFYQPNVVAEYNTTDGQKMTLGIPTTLDADAPDDKAVDDNKGTAQEQQAEAPKSKPEEATAPATLLTVRASARNFP